MKRKVAIARSLVNDPDLLIYDEPASGLDPLTTNYVSSSRAPRNRGKTVVFSAHNLYHVESVCDRVVIMNRRRDRRPRRPRRTPAEYGHTRYHVYTTVDVPDAVHENGSYKPVVESMDAVEATREQAEANGGDVVDIRTEESALRGVPQRR